MESSRRIFRYLKKTLDYSLIYSGYPKVLEGYSDANWVIDNLDVKFITGYLFLLGAAVSWDSCKQTIITRSILESELIALDTTCTEAQWLKNLINDIEILSPKIFKKFKL